MITKKKANFLPILALCAFLVGLDSLVVSPLIPSISQTIHFQLDLGGLLVTAYALLYGLSAPLFGPISDRWGRKNMIILGLLVFTVGTALTAAGSSLDGLMIFRAIAGLGGAMIMPSVFALIGDTIPFEIRGKAMGLIMGAMVGSTVIGVPIGTFLTRISSWRITFLIIAGLAMLVLLIALRGVPKQPPARQIPIPPVQAYIGQFKTAFSNKSVFFALLSTFLWTAGLHGMFAYVGVYYWQNFSLDASAIGLVILAAGLGSVFGNVIGGRLSDKVGKRTIVAIASVVAAAGVLTFASLTDALVGAIHRECDLELCDRVWSVFADRSRFGTESESARHSHVTELLSDVYRHDGSHCTLRYAAAGWRLSAHRHSVRTL